MNLEGIRRVMQLEAENERLRTENAELRTTLGKLLKRVLRDEHWKDRTQAV